MKIYTKNNLRLKSLIERTSGFVVRKGQIQLKEELTTASSSNQSGNLTANDISQASTGEDAGDTVEISGDKIDGNASTNKATISASGCKKNPNDPRSPLDTTKVNNKMMSLRTDPNVQKLGGLKNVNIDFSHRMPRPVMELRNNSVAYSKGELNKILLNQ